MRVVRLVPGRPCAPDAEGGVLARDLTVDGDAWHKGRRLSAGDLRVLARARVVRTRGIAAGDRGEAASVPVILVEPGDVHEDEAARRIALAVAGPGIDLRGPVESRMDLVASRPGVLRVDERLLATIDRWDPVAVFTALDGQVVGTGAVVAAAKVGPHVAPAAVVERLEAVLRAAAGRGRHVVRVDELSPRRIAVLVKETISGSAGPAFEATMQARVRQLGSDLSAMVRVPDDADATVEALLPLVRGPGRVDVILTAGAASTDPGDPFFVAVERLRGTVVSRGVPAHPGSMLWVARVGRTVVLGLPTCGAYSRATAVDLLLPWLLAGAPADRRTIARLGHGGLLTRDMRFRFPAYARTFDPPEG